MLMDPMRNTEKDDDIPPDSNCFMITALQLRCHPRAVTQAQVLLLGQTPRKLGFEPS